MKKWLFLLSLLISSGACFADHAGNAIDGHRYAKAKVYFFTWQFLSADAPRTPQETRDDFHEFVEMNDELVLDHFTKWLDLDSMKEGTSVKNRNVLLVIDLIRPDGHTDSYYSDGCLLFSGDFKLSRVVDESFRKQFDFVGGNLLMHTRTRDYYLCETDTSKK